MNGRELVGARGAAWPFVRAMLGAAALLVGGTACTHGETERESTGEVHQPLSAGTLRVLGFESLQDWSPLGSAPSLSLAPLHSEGQFSLSISGGGWMQVVSRPLNKEDPAPSVVGYDIRLPVNPVNQWWYGGTDLSIDAPSAGIFAQYLGHVELTGFPPGQFKRVEFAVPAALAAKLNGNYNDLTIRIAVNVPNNETAAYLVDHFTFGPVSTVCVPQPDGNPCTDDVCVDGVPSWPARPTGSPCDTNSTVCDGTGSCNASAQCILGSPPVVDDGNPCTTDACDPVAGVVHLPVATGVLCETDANVCNGISRCDGNGACLAGTPPVIDDGNLCTSDSCDAVAGVQHGPLAAGASCDTDGDVCSGSGIEWVARSRH